MINLGRCLAYLLGRHDRVAVAGIGTFRKDRRPSYFDDSRGLFYPSSDTFSFDADGGTGEGSELIVDYIVAQRRVSRPVAHSSYRKAISSILRALDTTGSVTLEGVGDLKQEGDQLVFTSSNHSLELADRLPVSEFVVVPLQENVQGQDVVGSASIGSDVTGVAAAETDSTDPGTIVANEGPVTTGAAEPEESVQPSRNGAVFWRVAGITAVVTGILLAAGAIFRPDLMHDLRLYLNRKVVPQNLEMPADEALTDVRSFERSPEESQMEGNARSSEEELSASPEATEIVQTGAMVRDENPVTQSEDPRGPVVTYEIIIGSFKTMEQAEKFVSQMKEKGIELRAIDSRQPRNRKKVSVGSYPTKEAAYRALPDIQKTLEPSAWVDRMVR